MFGSPSEEQRIAELAKVKTEGLDLSNHLTGWNALCRVWDEHPEPRAHWTFMGYGTEIGAA